MHFSPTATVLRRQSLIAALALRAVSLARLDNEETHRVHRSHTLSSGTYDVLIRHLLDSLPAPFERMPCSAPAAGGAGKWMTAMARQSESDIAILPAGRRCFAQQARSEEHSLWEGLHSNRDASGRRVLE